MHFVLHYGIAYIGTFGQSGSNIGNPLLFVIQESSISGIILFGV